MKKNIITGDLSLNKELISVLDDTPMMVLVDTNSPQAAPQQTKLWHGTCQSQRKETDCRFSRVHRTQCGTKSHLQTPTQESCGGSD